MDTKFIIQLIISFIIGGGFIALLSFLSEKVKKEYSGLIITLPSTIAISFFFIGWTTSKNEISNIAASTLIPWGISIFFISIYPYIAIQLERFVKNKLYQIFFTTTIVIFLWFFTILPFILNKFDNLFLSIIGYFIIILISNYILKRKNYKKSISIKYTKKEKIIRLLLSGLLMSIVVILSKVLNSFWGGIFGMFPITLITMVVIIHYHYGIKNIFPTIQNIAIGSLSIFVYVLISMVTFGKYGFILGTIFSYLTTMLFSFTLFKIQKNLNN